MENTSTKYSLNKVDAWKITRGLLVTLAGAFLVAVAQIYTQIDYTIGGINLTVFAVPFIGALIEAGRRYLSDYEAK